MIKSSLAISLRELKNNMQIVSLIHDVLKKIVIDGVPFNLAIKNEFRNGKNDLGFKKDVALNVGCTLRHYLVFNEIITRFTSEELQEEKKLALMILLSDFLFIKRLDENEKYSFIEEAFKDIKSIEEIKTLINEYVKGKNLIPDDYPFESNEFLSFRYNTPLWLVKMWKKHYGYHLCKKILKANSRSSYVYCRINNSKTKEVFLAENSDFGDTSLANDMVIYNGRSPLKDLEIYKSGDIFPFKTSIKNLFDRLDLDPIKGIAYYAGFVNLFYLEIMAKFSKYVAFDYIAGQSQAYFDAKKVFNYYGLKNVRLYEEKITSLETILSNKVHTFFVLPLNSNFSLLRNTPDYFLRFKKEMLDELIQGEFDSLNEASKFVEDGGDLVYIIPTISYKESHGVVEKFLLGNNQFSLLEEKQYLPCDDFDSSVYFAILRKNNKND